MALSRLGTTRRLLHFCAKMFCPVALNALAYASPSFSHPAKSESAAKADRRESTSTASQPPQTDSYDKTNGKVIIMPPKDAVRYGEGWLWPPEALAGMRVDTSGHRDKTISKEEITIFAGSAVAGNGGAGASDAQFKAALTREAVEYSALEKNIHNLLGFTLETFKTTFEAEGKLSAWASLADGTFFNSAFSGYAASYSIFSKYTFDDAFRAQYNTSPTMAVEYGFETLRAMMEAIIVKQSEVVGDFTAKITNGTGGSLADVVGLGTGENYHSLRIDFNDMAVKNRTGKELSRA